MPRKSEQEWAIIENEYITMPVTYSDLSKKYKLNIRAICVRSMKNKWDFKRKADIQKTTQIFADSQRKSLAKDNYNLIEDIREIIRLKSQAEKKLLLRALRNSDDKTLEKLLGFSLNKSKDSIAELAKLEQLLLGNATDRLEFEDADKEARKSRLDVLGFN